MIKNKLSDIVANQLPEHITEAYPTFVEFLQAYYKYLETQQVYRNIETVRDVETTLDTFIDLLKNEFAVEYPEFAKDRFFLKNTGHISVAHGSEQSYKFLFRQMFKKEVDIRYPKDQILTLSNSLWVQDISFFAKVTAGDVAKLENNFIQIDTLVNGIKTKNRVYVKRVEFVETTENTYEIFISKDYYGSILEGDTISYDGVFATVILTTVGIKIVKAGYGFSVGQVFNVESGTGSGLSFKITEVTLVGGIKSCQIITYGVNYTSTFAFDLPSSVILQDSVEVDGFKISAVSTQQRFYDSGIITKQNYYNSTYSNDYVGTIVADFSSLTVPSSVQINTARLQVNLGTVAKYQGYYSKSTGLVSSPDSIIQDSYYYQDFSYVLRIDEAFETYRDVVLSLLHPTGRQMFAEYVIDNLYELEYAIVEPIFKILLPLYSGIPDVVLMLDRLAYVLGKIQESEQVILDTVAKAVSKPVDSQSTIDDVKYWLFQASKASSVSPTEALYWTFAAPKFSDNIPTDALKYTLETPKTSSISTPVSAPSWVFAAPKTSSISTPTDVSYWTFAASKTSDNTILSAPSWVFAAPKASSVTPLSAPSWVFATPQASSINTPTDVSYWNFAAPKASSINTPTDASYWTFATPQASSINTPTDASYWTFATPQASSINTPTDSIPLTTNKVLGLTSVIRNLLTYTEQFDNAVWTKVSGASITANSTTAPDGNLTADTLTSTTSDIGVYQTANVTASTVYTNSVYLKAGTAAQVMLRDDVSDVHIVVNTTTWTVVSTSGTLVTYGISPDLNNSGWYRVYITYNTGVNTTARQFVRPTNGSTGTVYVWGAQLETGNQPTVYQGVAASGVLVEAASVRNLVLNSEQFNNSSTWGVWNALVTADAIIAPDGTLSADKLYENTAAGVGHYIEAAPSIATNQTYTQSVYVKAAETSGFRMVAVHVGASATTSEAQFSISGGVVTAGGFSSLITSSSVVAVGDGWYRCSITYTLNGTVTQHRQRIYSKQAGFYTGDGTSGIYVWGAQTEVGAYTTTYQRIGSTSNSADSLVVPGDSSLFAFAKAQASTLSTPTDTNTYSLNRLIAPAVNAFAAYSNDFTNANWSTLGSSTIANTIAAPDTSLTADTIAEDVTTTSQHRTLASFTAVVGNTYTTSYYLKAGTRNWVAVRLSEASTPDFAFFNLSTGTIGTVAAGLTARIENYGDGWYRCFVTRVATNVSMNSAINIATGDTVAIYTGLGSGYYLYAWGADAREIDPVVATDASYFSFAQLQTSTLSTPTDAIPLTTTKLLGLSSTIRNLLTYTEDFTQWSKSGATPSITNSTTVAAPNGAYTADSIIYPASGQVSANVYSNFTAKGAINTLYSGSIYLKSNGYNFVRVNFSNSAFNNNTDYGCVVDLSTGTIASIQNGSNCTINDAGNGWYRVTITAASDADGGQFVFIFSTVSSAGSATITTITPNGTSGIYAWGAQVEVGGATSAYQGVAADGVLVEAAAIRNLLIYTESATNWAKVNSTVTEDAAIAPDGSLTADKVIGTAVSSGHQVAQAPGTGSLTVGQNYTHSAYLKAGEYNYAYLLGGTAFSNYSALFNLTNGAVVSSTNVVGTPTSVYVGNGWYRCIVTFTPATTGTSYNYVQLADNTPTATFTGNGTSGIYVWGMQTELGSNPTTYQRIGTAATAADSLAVPTDSSKFTFATPQASALTTPTDATSLLFGTPKASVISTPTDTNALTTLRTVGNFDANSIRRNLLNYTEQFDNAAWSKGNITITANATTAPDGTTTAEKIVEAATTAQHLINQTVSSTLGLTYTYSIYAKAAEWTTFTLQMGAGGPVGNFNLTAKTATIGLGALYASIQDVGNGWFKCKVVGISNGFGNIYVFKTSASYAGDGTSGIYIWGAQLETASLAYSELTGFRGLAIATGSIFLTTSLTAAQQSTFAVGSYVTLYPTSSVLDTASPNIWMSGTITSWTGNSIAVNITSTSITTGTFVDWAFVLGSATNIFPSSAYQGIAANAVINANSVRNLIPYSEQFENAVWNKVSSSVVSNATTAPDGTTTADKIFELAASGVEHYTEVAPSIATNLTYTQSIYVKAAETTSFRLMAVHVGASTDTSTASFSISSGVITAGSFDNLITSTSITAVGNGWYRCALTYTLNGTVTMHRLRVYPKQAGLYTGDGTSGIYVWGAQVEILETASIYQPTLASGVALNSATLRNLLTYTEQFDNVIWPKTNCTVTADSTIAPDFTTTADTITRTAIGNHYIQQTYLTTTNANTTYTFSVWLKSGTFTGTIALRIRDGGGTNESAVNTFTITSTWQRYSITGTFGASPAANIIVYIDPPNDTGTAGETFYAWGAQLEIGSQASTYQRIASNNATDSLTFPSDNLNILTSRPVASSLSTPTDTQTFVTNKVVSFTQINTDSGNIYFNAFGADPTYFADLSFLQATQSF